MEITCPQKSVLFILDLAEFAYLFHDDVISEPISMTWSNGVYKLFGNESPCRTFNAFRKYLITEDSETSGLSVAHLALCGIQ